MMWILNETYKTIKIKLFSKFWIYLSISKKNGDVGEMYTFNEKKYINKCFSILNELGKMKY